VVGGTKGNLSELFGRIADGMQVKLIL